MSSAASGIARDNETTRALGSSEMPIVFEEVTGEIVPERETTEPESPDDGATASDDLASRIRRECALLQEREHRVRAD